MKLTPWQLIAVVAVLMAGIILAQVFAPGASATVVAMATTLFAALFVQRQEVPAAKPDPDTKPELELIDGGKK